MNVKKSIFMLTLFPLLSNTNVLLATEKDKLFFRTQSSRNLGSQESRPETEEYSKCFQDTDFMNESDDESNDEYAGLGTPYNGKKNKRSRTTSYCSLDLEKNIMYLLENFYEKSKNNEDRKNITKEIKNIILENERFNDVSKGIYSIIEQEIVNKFLNNGIYLKSKLLFDVLPIHVQRKLAISILDYLKNCKKLDSKARTSIYNLCQIFEKPNIQVANQYLYLFTTLGYINKKCR